MRTIAQLENQQQKWHFVKPIATDSNESIVTRRKCVLSLLNVITFLPLFKRCVEPRTSKRQKKTLCYALLLSLIQGVVWCSCLTFRFCQKSEGKLTFAVFIQPKKSEPKNWMLLHILLSAFWLFVPLTRVLINSPLRTRTSISSVQVNNFPFLLNIKLLYPEDPIKEESFQRVADHEIVIESGPVEYEKTSASSALGDEDDFDELGEEDEEPISAADLMGHLYNTSRSWLKQGII